MILSTLVIFFLVSLLNVSNADTYPNISSQVVQRNFGRKCYAVFNINKRTYEGARKSCLMYGGYLAIIRSNDMNRFLTETLKKAPNTRTAWIGLTDRVEENVYLWSDNTLFNVTTDFQVFRDGEGPLGSNRRAHDCAALTVEGDWIDVGCGAGFFNGNTRHYICEFDMNNVACNGGA